MTQCLSNERLAEVRIVGDRSYSSRSICVAVNIAAHEMSVFGDFRQAGELTSKFRPTPSFVARFGEHRFLPCR